MTPLFPQSSKWPLFHFPTVSNFTHKLLIFTSFAHILKFLRDIKLCGNFNIKFANFGSKLHFCTLNDPHFWESSSQNIPFFGVHFGTPFFQRNLTLNAPFFPFPVGTCTSLSYSSAPPPPASSKQSDPVPPLLLWSWRRFSKTGFWKTRNNLRWRMAGRMARRSLDGWLFTARQCFQKKKEWEMVTKIIWRIKLKFHIGLLPI